MMFFYRQKNFRWVVSVKDVLSFSESVWLNKVQGFRIDQKYLNPFCGSFHFWFRRPSQLAPSHCKCRLKCQGKLLFHCFTSAKLCLRKMFFHNCQKFNSKYKVDLDIYFLQHYIFKTRLIALLNQWYSYQSLTYTFFLSIQIQFTAILKRSDSWEFLPLEIKKHGRCFLDHDIMFICKNFKLCSHQVLNFFVFFKPNAFIWFVLGVWFYIRFLCKFKPTNSEFLISTAPNTEILEKVTRIGYLNGWIISWMG